MKIIVGGNVVKMLSKFVSYMRIDVGYNYDTLMKLKSKMLKFVQSHIKKDILNNGAYTSRSYACWWTDGKSGRALVFDYTILPHQELVLIYKMRYESMENIIESVESVRDIQSLINRIENKQLSRCEPIINDEIVEVKTYDGIMGVKSIKGISHLEHIREIRRRMNIKCGRSISLVRVEKDKSFVWIERITEDHFEILQSVPDWAMKSIFDYEPSDYEDLIPVTFV